MLTAFAQKPASGSYSVGVMLFTMISLNSPEYLPSVADTSLSVRSSDSPALTKEKINTSKEWWATWASPSMVLPANSVASLTISAPVLTLFGTTS